MRDYAPGARTRFLAIITNPTIAYLLLLAGIFGLALEAMHPGAMLPGIVGGICLLVGLYALQLLPVNYAGLALMALGIGLLVAEAVNPTRRCVRCRGRGFVRGGVGDADEYRRAGLRGQPGRDCGDRLVRGGLAGSDRVAGVSFAALAHQFTGDDGDVYRYRRTAGAGGADGEAWVLVRGERWRVHCDTALPAGARVRVVQREGLLLQVVPA